MERLLLPLQPGLNVRGPGSARCGRRVAGHHLRPALPCSVCVRLLPAGWALGARGLGQVLCLPCGGSLQRWCRWCREACPGSRHLTSGQVRPPHLNGVRCWDPRTQDRAPAPDGLRARAGLQHLPGRTQTCSSRLRPGRVVISPLRVLVCAAGALLAAGLGVGARPPVGRAGMGA